MWCQFGRLEFQLFCTAMFSTASYVRLLWPCPLTDAEASEKQETGARTLRPKITKRLKAPWQL